MDFITNDLNMMTGFVFNNIEPDGAYLFTVEPLKKRSADKRLEVTEGSILSEDISASLTLLTEDIQVTTESSVVSGLIIIKLKPSDESWKVPFIIATAHKIDGKFYSGANFQEYMTKEKLSMLMWLLYIRGQ